jgi:DeoR family transcriptional regulator, fructose operon transcriptional repressor
MPAEARRMQIIDILNRAGNGVVGVNDLARQLSVSEMTIRRDLDWLEQRSILTRIHGGALAYQGDDLGEIEEKSFQDRLKESNTQKKAIGWAAAQLVQDGDRIILDAGTTTQQIARHLSGKTNLTIITNNLAVGSELARFPHIDTIVLGGNLKQQELCTVGPMAKQGMSILAADKVFLSTSGFTTRSGITEMDMREVEIKQAMMQAARRIILVADSTKYGLTQLVRVCPIQAIHILVTDSLLPPEAQAELEAEGLRVITPDRLAQSSLREGDSFLRE